MDTGNKRHYAVIDTYKRKIKLTFEGQVLAESSKVLILKEVGTTVYNPVFYFPKEDIKMDLIPDSTRFSHCPIKGDASYWNIEGGPTDNYFAWSYENALPRTKKISGYVAFNMDYLYLESSPV